MKYKYDRYLRRAAAMKTIDKVLEMMHITRRFGGLVSVRLVRASVGSSATQISAMIS